MRVTEKMTVRIGVLGAGRIGQVHAQTLAHMPDTALIAIAEPDPIAAQTMGAVYGCDIRTVQQIADADDVDAVVICTPTDTHADLIELFARAGKAIFCEKPVDLSLARVRDCVHTVADTGAQLMIGFQRRFDPDFRALRAVIDAGRIGEVEMVTLTSRDPGPPPIAYIERSGGIFRDMTIHDFDMARWMLGEEVTTVFAAGSNLVDPAIGAAGDYDSVNVLMTTANGKQCTITNSRRATYGYDQRVEVHGSDGAVRVDNHHKSRIELATGTGYLRPPLMDFFMTRYLAAYAAEMASFVAAVRTGGPMATTGHDGLMALALAEAAIRSAQSGQIV
jgi:myo-inositol 2-dehydrogenase/D-chiro-inositol 1-dehydrogenase